MPVMFRKPLSTTGLTALVLLLSLIIVAPNSASAQGKTELKLGFWGSADSECSPDHPAYYVGGVYGIRVTLWPEGKRPVDVQYAGISDWAWPGGLVIGAGQSLSPEESFQPSAMIEQHLQLEYYVTEVQAKVDSLWRATDQVPKVMGAPEYHFAFCVPLELANSYLCVNAEWDHPTYGHLSARPICVKIVAPCSETAQHKIWSTRVRIAQEQMRYDMAVQLADSFVALAWHELSGLVMAEIAAKRLGRYDDAIRFLDLCFEWNHMIETPMEGWTLDSATTEVQHRLYEQNRARLVELKNQQEKK